MKNYKHYNIEIKAGKRVIATCESPVLAAVKIKQLCPDLSSQVVLNRMYENLGMKARFNTAGDLVNRTSKFGGMYSVKLVSKNQPLKEMKELDLVLEYQSTESIQKKDRIFSEMVNRYQGYLVNHGRRVQKSIPADYFAMDFEDCYGEALYGFKLALEAFDIDRVGRGFDETKFSIAYYAERQISARIGTYWYKYNKKKTRSAESYSTVFKDRTDEEGGTIVTCSRNQTQEVESSMQMELLESRLSETERKIKDFLIEGMKESKIRSSLNINQKMFESAKENIKKAMLEINFQAV